VDLRLDRPDPDAYAPTYVSERPLDVANTMQQSSPRSEILQALSIGDEDENLLFPDDDMVDSLPSGPVEEEPSTANELVSGIVPPDPYSSTADAFKALTNDDLAGLDDIGDEEDEAPAVADGPHTQNELDTGIKPADPFSSTEEAFKALTRDDIDRAEQSIALGLSLGPDDQDDDDELNLSIDEPPDDDPLNTHQSTDSPTQQDESDFGELRPKSALLEKSEIDELDDSFFDDDEEEDEDEYSDYEDEDEDEDEFEQDREPMPSVPEPAPAVQQTADLLAADAPMDHAPGPETLGAIQAAMPGFGKSRWMGRALLIGLSLAFLGLGGLVISKLVQRGPDTSPAAGLSTSEPESDEAVSEKAEEAVEEKSPEERAKEQYGRGNLSAQANDLVEAKEHYRKALEIDPDHAGSLAGLSAALIKEKRYADAKPMLEELLRVAPKEGAAHLTLGLVAHKLDEPEARGKAINAFIKLEPSSPHHAKLLELLTGGTIEPNDDAPGVE